MNAAQLYRRADDWAENAFLKLIGRLGMATAFPVLIASTSWLGSTLWTMNTNEALLAGKVDVLSERISDELRAANQRALEHERRLQRLEDELEHLRRMALPPAR